MWCHVMQCKPTGVYVHSWLSFCDRHKLNVISLSILIVCSWNQPFVKNWAHVCYEIHKKWWVYTAGLLGPASRNDQWYWMQQCNQNICKLILIIYPEVTCVASPHLKRHTSELLLTAGHIRTCCVDAWTNCVWALPIMDAQWYSTLNVAKQSKYNWTTFNFYTELPHVQLICDWHVTCRCTLHVSTHNVGCVWCTPQWCVHMWASMRSFS